MKDPTIPTKKPEKKKTGRPKSMTDSKKREALIIIKTTTKTMAQVCRDIGVVKSTFTLALAEDEVFSNQYACAKVIQSDLLFEDILAISKKKSKDSVAATDKRTELDALKWYLSKRHPKKYGDRTQVTMQGQDPGEAKEAPAPIIIQSTSNVDYDKLPIEVLDAIIAAKKKNA